MKLYQPLLFVGLGGTGCSIGAELERRLREEICGPDGTAFQQHREDALRYQLPDCVQFVYADINQADLERLPLRVVPGPLHVSAAQLNAHYVRGLVPRHNSYPEVAESLRLSSEREVEDWLPGKHGEPRVAPLQLGAGQLPTIGRAALFETLRGGIGKATAELSKALGKIAGGQVSTDLYKLGGQSANPKAVDVFVAFSIAGGTGAGIFYDYLHLIGELFSHTDLRLKIYPLVLMPSAFTEGRGGGRAARLNAGRAVLDLFQLVDQQNAGDIRRTLGGHSAAAGRSEVAVHYPVEGRIRLETGVAQTAFLFSRPLGAEPRDLRRSVVSLVLSLIGTEYDHSRSRDNEQYQSFADSFINGTVERQVPAENGIGNQGVSTALVASLTVPVDELADVVAGRLLRTGIEDLAVPLPGEETNQAAIKDFFTIANIQDIFARSVPQPAEPEIATGAQAVSGALRDRLESMRSTLGQLRIDLDRTIPETVAKFDPRGAAHELLGSIDPFRLQRTVFGHAEFSDEVDKIGVRGLMTRRRSAPPPPPGVRESPPEPPPLKDSRLRISRVRWSDPEVVDARSEQDAWFRWRCHVLWTEPWNTLAPRWTRQLDHLQETLQALTRSLLEQAREDREQFRTRSDVLYQPRVGVSYLLPPGGNLDRFYERVVARITRDLVADGRLQPSARPSALLQALIDKESWRESFRLAGEHNLDLAVGQLREQLKTQVKTYFLASGPGQSPLLPTLRELLAEAARPTGRLPDEDLEDFRSKLAGLVPSDFSPQGTGRLKVLVTYAAAAESDVVESYLQEVVNLPQAQDRPEFRATSSESISVVLFRSAMGVTEVREVRELLRLWAEASDRPERQDYLKWRQRTGYRSGYLLTTEEHRVHILHRLLCAVWNGKVKTFGDPASPDQIAVRLAGEVEMTLDLAPLRGASSWASLLRSYERWTFADNDGIRREFCKRLMSERPNGLTGRPAQPSGLYWLLDEIAAKEIAYIDEKLADPQTANRSLVALYRDFWATTFPGARDFRFGEADTATFHSLRDLEGYIREGGR
jgi:hypothetical protein